MKPQSQTHLKQNKNFQNSSAKPLATDSFIRERPSDEGERQIQQRLLKLEGECKVVSYEYIRFSLVKTVLWIIPLIVSIAGLFLLKYSISFRVRICYEQSKEEEASHLYVMGNHKSQQIVEIETKNPVRFKYKKLSYVMEGTKAVPAGFKYQKCFKTIFSDKHVRSGLTEKEVAHHSQLYGKNQHNIQIPNFFQYLLDVLTTPFFLLQYIFCIIYILENLVPFAIALLFFSFLGVTVNYIMLYISFDKIKSMAEKQIRVNVIREGKVVNINSVHLVPGDVFEPKEEIPCDALVLRGDVYVNEANLTGESHPIGKFPVTNLASLNETNRWLYEGSKVVESRSYSRGIVINTGFQTFRGRIIRRILSRSAKQPDLFRSALVFLIQILIITVIAFFASLPLLLSRQIQPLFIVFQFFNFLTSALPPPLPIFFHVAYSFSLSRLKLKEISGTEPQKTLDGAYLKTMCFDKTGTLTENEVQIKKVLRASDDGSLLDVKSIMFRGQNSLVKKLFASCHTVKEIDGQVLGDEIDKEMYIFSEFQMLPTQNPLIKFLVQGPKGEILEVLRINQFQSKFQSMSILVRDAVENVFYIFVKGAPEKIKRNSLNRIRKYDETVAELSLSGYRTISFGYKVIEQDDVPDILQIEREFYEKDLTLLGVVGFENKLKNDARKMMRRIRQSNIDPKMITGDNIFIAVETATRAGIIQKQNPIILLEGANQNPFEPETERKFRGILLTRTSTGSTSKDIELTQNDTYLTQNHPIAIDNTFLTLDPPPVISDKTVLFARIPPENKALIISRYKQKIKERLNEVQTSFEKFLKKDRVKVGMCGDGANDLLALKEADLSLGIQESDASYGSSFTIKKLIHIDDIIRQSKGTQANIIQMYQYYTSISFFGLVCSVIMISDVTFFSSTALLFFSFTSTLLFPVLFTLSRPSDETTIYTPDSNFMSLHNHLVYWGNMIISSMGVIAGYFYYINTDEYQPNENPQATVLNGFNSKTYTSTIIFLMVLLPFNFNALFIYSSAPWKERFFGNFLFSFMLILNISISGLFFFITRLIAKAFELQPIAPFHALILLAIMGGTVLLSFVYNEGVRSCKLDYKVLQ